MEPIFIIIIGLLVYFVPTIVAYNAKPAKRNRASILVINLFLGWSIIGWVIALAMAVGKENSYEQKNG